MSGYLENLLVMIKNVDLNENRLYRLLFEFAQSLSGHGDLQSLCDAFDRTLHQVVEFDFLAVVIHDAARNLMRLHAASGPPLVPPPEVSISVVDTPAEWILQEQQSIIIPDLTTETRWPGFVTAMLARGVRGVTLVPLSNGPRRLGILALGRHTVDLTRADELALVERFASEAAVAIDAYLMQQQLTEQRDRLQVLFDVTIALVSKLPWDELFASISYQLSRIVSLDFAGVNLYDEGTGLLSPYALHFSGEDPLDEDRTPLRAKDLPSWDALNSGKAVILHHPDFVRYPSSEYRRLVSLGFHSSCSIPLITPNKTIGTLEVARTLPGAWTDGDVELLTQVARQIAIAVENSLSYKQLAELQERLATENLYLQDEIRTDRNPSSMVGNSPAFEAVMRSVQIVAPTSASVLVLGETGTGKELVARAIHDLSERKNHTFVKVNCAAIPAALLESELFGHEKGAFTGALGQKIGRFEFANHGTLFLDEVGEISLELQSKLLRAIQEQEFERLGSNRTIRVNIRIIAATNRNLKAMVDEGKFRSDLYYRLHVFPIELPPLRERRSDIPLLIRYFAQKFAQQMNRQIKSIPKTAIETLAEYDWPGNIRELQNVIERSVILTDGPVLQVAMPDRNVSSGARSSLKSVLPASAERERILRALKDAGGVVGGMNGAAERLGMRRTTLQSRMKKLNIGRDYS